MGAFWYCQHAPQNSKVKRPAIQRHIGSTRKSFFLTKLTLQFFDQMRGEHKANYSLTLKSWDRKVVILEKRRENSPFGLCTKSKRTICRHA
jgi:hypothetical protein